MKKYFIILIVGLLYSNLNAQVSFVDSTNRWFVSTNFPNGSLQFPSFLGTKTETFGNYGDTTIGGQIWQKIGSSSDSNFTAVTKKGFTKVNGQIVLFRETATSPIDTLYDYSIGIGDSVLYDIGFFGINYIRVDSIQFISINGQNHKKIIFETVYAPLCCVLKEVWIEGIGSLHGPLFSRYPTVLEIESYDQGNDLTCFRQQNLSLWSSQKYSQCYNRNILNVANLAIQSTIKVFPNPTQGEFFIEKIEGNSYTNISIFNQLGQHVNPDIIETENQFKIDFSAYSTGIYFAHISSSKGEVVIKIIKE